MKSLIGLTAALCVLFHMQPALSLGCGIASWYGEEERGDLTANGEVFNPDKLTAANWESDFGTKVKVTNQANGKSVVVRINDRGAAHWTGVAIDLSRSAFAKIADPDLGRIRVCTEEVK